MKAIELKLPRFTRVEGNKVDTLYFVYVTMLCKEPVVVSLN